MKQIVAHPKVRPFHGILLILGILVIMGGLNYLITLIGRTVGATAAAIAFWVIGIVIVLWMFRTYVLVYQYTIEDGVLFLSRRYGKRLRSIDDVYLNQIVYVGTKEEAKKRYPEAKRLRVVHSRCKLPVTAVVHNTASGIRILHLQANDELRGELVACVKRNRK